MDATRQVLDEVMRWAEARLDRRLTVEVLAHRAGYSAAHFSRAFSAMAGESPARWLTGRRVAKATGLLTSSRAHVLDIALACGFDDATTFARAFRRRTGLSPSAFRASVRPQEPRSHAAHVRIGGIAPSAGFRLCGLMADVAADPAAPGALWQALFRALDEMGIARTERELRQVAFWRGDPTVRYTCVAGFVGGDADGLPLPFVSVDVPPCLCRCFIVEGEADCLAGAYAEIYGWLLAETGDRPAADFVFERPRPAGRAGVEIWLPVALR